MADSGRVHPDCVNAANPYHECGVACLEKIAQGQTKTSLEKKKKKSGSFILDGSLSFGRKKKGSESRPQSPQVVKKDAVVKPAYVDNTPSPRYAKKKVESENSQSFSSSQQNSDESYSRDTSWEKKKVRSSDSLPTSENIMPATPKAQSKGEKLNGFAVDLPAKPEDSPMLQGSPGPVPNGVTKNAAVMTSGPLYGPLDFVFSGISRTSEENSDDDESQSLAESCVSVGKYRVRTSIASTLELIFSKYGDIAANCRLESASMRSYYLECLCNVVQELRSTSVKQLTNLKLKEMVAVVKDVESVRIDVSWLSTVLTELIEGMELQNQQQAAKERKANYDKGVETTRKEIESMMEELAQKEKEVADIKSRVEKARERLGELELESSQLRETISSINSKVEKFHLKPLVEDIL